MQIMRFVVFFIQEYLYSNILSNSIFIRYQFTTKKLRIPYFTSFGVFRMPYFAKS